MRASLFAIFLMLVIVVVRQAGAQSATLDARRAQLKRLLDEQWEYTLRTQPELATQAGDDRYNDRLRDFSDKAIAQDLEHSRQTLKKFEALDVTGFPEQEKLNHTLMVRSLRDAVELARFRPWEMPAPTTSAASTWNMRLSPSTCLSAQ